MGIISDIKKDSWPISIALDVMETGDRYQRDGMEDPGFPQRSVCCQEILHSPAFENSALCRWWCLIYERRTGNGKQSCNNETG
jgi:hypothetical protein